MSNVLSMLPLLDCAYTYQWSIHMYCIQTICIETFRLISKDAELKNGRTPKIRFPHMERMKERRDSSEASVGSVGHHVLSNIPCQHEIIRRDLFECFLDIREGHRYCKTRRHDFQHLRHSKRLFHFPSVDTVIMSILTLYLNSSFGNGSMSNIVLSSGYTVNVSNET